MKKRFIAAAVPVLVLYTGLFRHPGALLDVIGALPVYLSRGIEPDAHVQPSWYYLGRLAWSSSRSWPIIRCSNGSGGHSSSA